MGVRLFKKFLSALVDSLQHFGQDYSVTDYTCPGDAEGSDGKKRTGNYEWQNAYEVSYVKETKRSHGPSFHESRTADFHTNQTRPSQRSNNEKTFDEMLLKE